MIPCLKQDGIQGLTPDNVLCPPCVLCVTCELTHIFYTPTQRMKKERKEERKGKDKMIWTTTIEVIQMMNIVQRQKVSQII